MADDDLGPEELEVIRRIEALWADTERSDLADLLISSAYELAGRGVVMSLILERVAMGQKQYGLFDLANDKRDFRSEALCEIADALVYVACDELRAEITHDTDPPSADTEPPSSDG